MPLAPEIEGEVLPAREKVIMERIANLVLRLPEGVWPRRDIPGPVAQGHHY
jgi:hypothetical protein